MLASLWRSTSQKKLRESINIKDVQGRRIQQVVEYEWKPLYCNKCQRAGHVFQAKPKGGGRKSGGNKQWKVKPDTRQEEAGETF